MTTSLNEKTVGSSNKSELKDSLIPDEEKKQAKISEVKSLKDLWMWFIKDPISRWPIVFFLISLVAVILWLILYLASGNSGYIIAGIAGCVTAFYGFYHFRLLMALKEEVEKVGKLNKDFRRTNADVIKEVNNLNNAATQLRTTENTLRESTETQKKKKFN